MRIFEGFSVFFFIGMLLVLSTFLLGNFQEFLERSQLMLLGILRVTSLLCVLSSAYYGASLVIWMIRRRKLLLVRLVYDVFSVAIGVVVAFGANALTVLIAPV